MFGFFIWFIFVIIIIVASSSNKNKTTNTSKNYHPDKYRTINSYYNDKKVNSYKKQEEDHSSHTRVDEEEDDVCSNIGYKKCPKCESTVSLKSKECFMCGYEFKDKN